MKTPASKINPIYAPPLKKKRTSVNLSSKEAHAEGEGSWIFSFADLMTIMVMFFVLLLSISKPNKEKFNAIAKSITSKVDEKQAHPEPKQDTQKVQTAAASAAAGASAALEKIADAGGEGGPSSRDLLEASKILLSSIDTESLENDGQASKDWSAMNAELQSLASSLNAKESKKRQESGFWLEVPAHLMFENSAVKVKKEAQAILETVVSKGLSLKSVPEIKVTVETSQVRDNGTRRTAEQSRHLTMRQGQGLFTELRKLGYPADRLGIWAVGHERINPANSKEEQRRVTLEILYPRALK